MAAKKLRRKNRNRMTTGAATANAMIRRLRYSANLLRRDRLSDAMREHEAMVDALRRRNGEELGKLMFDHMRGKCEAVCEYMREHRPNGRAADVSALRSEEN